MEELHRRELRLVNTPKWIWRYTCRCREDFGHYYDTERALYSCKRCNLPDTNSAHLSFTRFVSSCIGCGNDFVVWTTLKAADFCKDCGGTNFALPGQRNSDPHNEVDYVNEQS